MRTHLLPEKLAYGKGTRACWSKTPTKKALIFVHGFNGDAILTWKDFDLLLTRDPDLKDCDFIFYGYDGLNTRSSISSAFLRNFVTDLWNTPSKLIHKSILRRTDRDKNEGRYEKLFFIGHSLGAVVSRDALLQGYISGLSWASQSELILFAPAHCGTQITRLVKDCLGGKILKLATAGMLLKWYKVLQDLDEGCDTLRKLEEDTKDELNSGASTLKAKKVIHPEGEEVINPRRFAKDPPLTPFERRNHIDVCKPVPPFLDPLNAVVDIVR